MYVRRLIVLFSVFLLSACTFRGVDVPRTDTTTLQEVFHGLTINADKYLVNRADQVGSVRSDTIEMAEIVACEAITLQFVTSSQIPYLQEDYMLKATPEGLYDTRTMKRTPLATDICTPGGIASFFDAHTGLAKNAIRTNEELVELALSLQEPRFHTEGSALILRGIDPSVKELPDNENAMVEIKYRDGRLLEIHFRREYDFPSTKQQSNYISGTHYYYGEGPISEFPPLTDFAD